MKTRFVFPALFVLLAAVALSVSSTLGQSRKGRAAKEFMRDKLELTQRILEGITMEDWDLVIAKGIKLSAMTQEADWRLFDNPDYDQHSKTFKKHADAVVEAAKKKDAERATLAYMRLTMNCVDCHKAVRGKMVAALP